MADSRLRSSSSRWLSACSAWASSSTGATERRLSPQRRRPRLLRLPDSTSVPARPDGFQARDPNAPKPSTQPAGTVHKVTFDIVEKQVEIAPGVSQLMWTYNGQVPGPILRGKVGDTFEVKLVNHGSMCHSIDFHASEVAPNITMRMIGPATNHRLQVHSYPCRHLHVPLRYAADVQHMAMGMYGAVIIDPPNLAPVAHEYVFVQSELYRESDPSQPVDYNKLLAEQWDAVVFNGYVSQYTDRPIRVQPNQKIRVWVVDDGPPTFRRST